MSRISRNSRVLIGVLLALLLVGIQTISLAHAYGHEPASLGDKACATCVSINQLACATVDSGHLAPFVDYSPVRFTYCCDETGTPSVASPRQRSPPAIS